MVIATEVNYPVVFCSTLQRARVFLGDAGNQY